MAQLQFSEIKPRIEQELLKRGLSLGINEKVTLLDGFADQFVKSELSESPLAGITSALPMIMVRGNTSGRIYYFSLQHLLPDLPL